MRIVEFCNSNSGFISAVLATLSFVLSAVAIFISVQTSTHQAQISLLEKRFDIYSKIQKIQKNTIYVKKLMRSKIASASWTPAQ